MKTKITNKVIEDYYQDSQLRFVAELKDRLVYLKRYFDSRYSPLQAKFEINVDKENPYIRIYFSLVGENGWTLGKRLNVGEIAIGQLQYQSHLAERYYVEIRDSLQKEVIKEGIRSINTRLV